jgi:hypothetical protein
LQNQSNTHYMISTQKAKKVQTITYIDNSDHLKITKAKKMKNLQNCIASNPRNYEAWAVQKNEAFYLFKKNH